MRCSSCKEEKPESEFPPSVFARGSGQCRACSREYAREYKRRALATPEGREVAREASRRARAAPEGLEASRAQSRLSKYGLTEEAFAALIAAQDGRCAICGTDEPGAGRSWHVDHDHACCPGRRVTCGGKCVRGLLCQRCNTGLGYFRDNPAILESAIGYLNRSTTRTT